MRDYSRVTQEEFNHWRRATIKRRRRAKKASRFLFGGCLVLLLGAVFLPSMEFGDHHWPFVLALLLSGVALLSRGLIEAWRFVSSPAPKLGEK